MSTSSKEPKYRPVLTMPQISLVMLALPLLPTEHAEEAKELLGYLEVFKLKQKVGLTASAYATTPRKSIEEKLGMDDPISRREAAFAKFDTFGAALCTNQELADAQLYRYENDLMTPEEEAEYEFK